MKKRFYLILKTGFSGNINVFITVGGPNFSPRLYRFLATSAAVTVPFSCFTVISVKRTKPAFDRFPILRLTKIRAVPKTNH